MLQPIAAGLVGALTGFFGSFAVLLTGLRAAGADEGQAASGLLALCVAQGVLSIALSLRTRLPVSFVWSTPGAALLVAAHRADSSFSAAVVAFALAGLLITATGVFPQFARLIERIPVAVSGALLAGILLPFCLAPVTAAVQLPLLALPIVLLWLVLTRVAPRWAAPTAIVAAIVLTLVTGTGRVAVGLPSFEVVPPQIDWLVIVGLAVPLAVVTMAGQNLPGLAVLTANGYRAPTRGLLVVGGLATVAVAPFGGHAVNLAAITGALTAGPEAGEQSRRWIAGVTTGVVYLLLGLGAAIATSLLGSAPPLLIEAGAGLALLGAFASGLTTALHSPETRIAAVVTFLVVASGIVVAGIGSAFWGIVAGLLALLVLRPRRPA